MAEDQVFGWHEQLSVGNKGERYFQTLYPSAVKTNGRVDDFVLNGKRIELKTDTYSMAKTPNFFMEYVGNTKSGAIGGPWRTCKDNIDYFVYLFLYDKKLFWFNACELSKFLDEKIKTMKPKRVKNATYEAYGFAVNRDEVAHLQIDPTKI